jgi:polar amino acid transport system substrate-binding protein
MLKKMMLLAFVLSLLLAACAAPATPAVTPPPAPTQPPPTTIPTREPPTAVPTSAPATGGDAVWNKIQQAGKIVVGTAADYEPFEFYTPAVQLDGFDIALMKAIGQKLGVEVEFNDFAFEGLGGALQLGQVDAAVAAISVTRARLAEMDFSNVYYVSSDAVLAPADSTLTVQSAADVADKKVGVQAGTVYEALVNDNVAYASGSGGGTLVYQSAEEMLSALKAKQIDVALLGKEPAQAAAQDGSLKIVGGDFTQQLYAIALPKGSSTLRTRINEALTALQNDGTLSSLSHQYLKDAEAVTQPLPDMAPEPPAQPPACVDGMAFVQDLSYDDHNLTQLPTVQPGAAFTKSWRVLNSGTCTWSANYFLVFNHGNNLLAQMGGQPVAVTREVLPGQTYDFGVNLVAPEEPGQYTAVWNLRNAQNVPFGESLWVAITVPGQPTVEIKPATTLDFDVKLIGCRNNPTPERPGGVILTLQFQPVGGTEPYRFFDMDEGIEVQQTFERAGSFGSATVVAFGVLSADGQGREKRVHFAPGSFGPAGCN